MDFLSKMELSCRGQSVSMKQKCPTGDLDMMSLMWLERDRHYFISKVCRSLPRHTIYRERWSKDGDESRKVMMEIEIPDVYFGCQNALVLIFVI